MNFASFELKILNANFLQNNAIIDQIGLSILVKLEQFNPIRSATLGFDWIA